VTLVAISRSPIAWTAVFSQRAWGWYWRQSTCACHCAGYARGSRTLASELSGHLRHNAAARQEFYSLTRAC